MMKSYQMFPVLLRRFLRNSADFPCSDMAFDSTIGSCLDVLHSRCPADIVRLTAAELVSAFYNSLLKTKSCELQVNFPFFPKLPSFTYKWKWKILKLL